MKEKKTFDILETFPGSDQYYVIPQLTSQSTIVNQLLCYKIMYTK